MLSARWNFFVPLAVVAVFATTASGVEEDVRFSRDILPILSENCLHCHGQDEKTREGQLRLDTSEGALRKEQPVIVVGRADDSELIRRITSTDPDLVMPPPATQRRLSPQQVDLLKRWINQGARWGKHWAFERIERPTLPAVRDTAWVRQPLDRFVLHALEARGWRPHQQASPEMLARRVSLDLTGLPPAVHSLDSIEVSPQTAGTDRQRVDSMELDESYRRLVEQSLASPHHGERLAWFWLDAARYSDTDGYQGDDTRTNWPWRDWVIESLARGMPFDQFTLEQFAGDLLPNSTPEQRLATCFHRNHMTNGEGGRDPEESRIDYVIDRVNTVGALWLGLTLGCCQCHSHKYDPISQAEYYRLSAFFNSIDETGAAGRKATPYLSYQSPRVARAVAAAQRLVDQRAAVVARTRKAAETPFQTWLAEQWTRTRGGFAGWISFSGSTRETSAGSRIEVEEGGILRVSGDDPFHEDYRVIGRVELTAKGRLQRITGLQLEVLADAARPEGGLSRSASGHFILTDIKVQIRRQGSAQVREWMPVNALASYAAEPGKNGGYGDIRHTLDDDPRNGWATFGAPDPRQTQRAVFRFAEPLELASDEELVLELQQRSTRGHANIGRFRWSLTDQAGPAVTSLDVVPLEQLATTDAADINSLPAALRDRLFEQYLVDDADYQAASRAHEQAKSQLSDAKKAEKVDVMVLAERSTPRETHVLIRGEWDKKGDVVARGVPESLGPWNSGEDTSRVALARWLVSRDNPLAARVLANHLWQMCFGYGLVRTPEDFGLQGERPTHPELLDWLAAELMDSGWDTRHLLRQIVTSATYQQSSDAGNYRPLEAGNDPRQIDAENRLLWRGARYRLPSWMIRDSALRVSGLLNPALGGPPIRPYQPSGVWEEMFMGRFKYEPTEGAEQYRRSIYAFWRRSSAPTFLFDNAQRRVCEVRTTRTNTPLQALALLNDLTYLEASRALAIRVHQEVTPTTDLPDRERLTHLWRVVLARHPSPKELVVLERELARARSHYSTNARDAEHWLSHGQTTLEPPAGVSREQYTTEIAAFAVVASMVLNLDETLNRQ